MKGFIFFGFVIAVILQAECRSTHSIVAAAEKATDACKEYLLRVNSVPDSQVYGKLVECVALQTEIINDQGILNTDRLKDYVFEKFKGIPPTTLLNLVQKCTDRNGHYNGKKLVKIMECFISNA